MMVVVAVVIPTGSSLPRGFRWIAAPLTSMLKMTGSSDLAPRELGTDEVVGGGGRADETVVDLSSRQKSKNLKGLKNLQKPSVREKQAS